MAMVDDLMDRSRVAAAIDGVAFTRDPASCADADVVIIDVARHADAVSAARAAAPSARIVAFGPHVDDAVLAQAGTHGADVVLARSVFFRDPGAAVTAK
jgi:DNA-binding NarL/FixJ family response regulator